MNEQPTSPHQETPEQQTLPPTRARRQAITPVSLALIAVIVLIGGFFIGFFVEKGHGSSTSSPLAAGRFGNFAGANGASRAGTGGTGGRFAGAAGGSFSVGKVTAVSGNTVTITNTSTKKSMTITIPSSVKVSKTVTAPVSSIKTGDNIVVSGSTKNGKLTATSVRDSGTMTATFGAGFGAGFGGRTSSTGGGPGAVNGSAPGT